MLRGCSLPHYLIAVSPATLNTNQIRYCIFWSYFRTCIHRRLSRGYQRTSGQPPLTTATTTPLTSYDTLPHFPRLRPVVQRLPSSIRTNSLHSTIFLSSTGHLKCYTCRIYPVFHKVPRVDDPRTRYLYERDRDISFLGRRLLHT